MSADTDIISTTDLRLWVEELTANVTDRPCEIKIVTENYAPCRNEAVVRLVFNCGCHLDSCVRHRDMIFAGPAPLLNPETGRPGDAFRCGLHKQEIQLLRVDSLR